METIEQEVFTWELFEDACETIAQIINDQEIVFDQVYGLPRGGLCLAVKLSHLLDIPLTTHKKRITKQTLICDDLSDSGKTLISFRDHFIVTLYYKKTSLVKPDIYLLEKTDKWIKFPWEK
jgi:uncharacterized protein